MNAIEKRWMERIAARIDEASVQARAALRTQGEAARKEIRSNLRAALVRAFEELDAPPHRTPVKGAG